MKIQNKNEIQDYIKVFVIGTIGYFFITLFKISILKTESSDISYLLLDIFGNLNIDSNKLMMNYGMYIYNFLVIMYVTSSYIYDDFGNNATYIFTRTNNRSKWIQNKIIGLVGVIIKYFSIQYVLVIILGLYQGFMIDNIENLFVVIGITFVHISLSVIVISLITNIFAFKIGGQISYAIGTLIISISILFIYIGNIFSIPNKSYGFMPFINTITSWYSELNSIIDREIYLFNFYIEGNSLIINIMITCMIIVILQRILKKIVCNIEIL